MMKKNLLKQSLFVFALMGAGTVTSALAQTYNWAGGNSNFYLASNWTSTQGDVVFDDSSFKTVRTNTNGASPVMNSTMAWQPGIFDSTGGNLTINADFNVYFNDMLNGAVTVNSGAIFTCRNIIRVGRDGTGVLNVNGTVRSLHETNFQSIFIGALAGNGTVNVNDGGLLSGGYQIEVGSRDFYPTGVLNVNEGGIAEAYWVTAIGPNGTVNLNGGTINTGQVLIVGDLYLDTPTNPGTIGTTVGSININSGTITVNQNDLAEPALNMHPNGKIMIDNGTLAVKRTGVDFSEMMNNYVTAGQIVAAPNKQIVVNYDGVLTTVTAQAVTATKDFTKNMVSVFPNPAKNVVTVSMTNGTAENLSVTVINMLGATVVNSTALNAAVTNVNVSGLAAGIYVLQVSNGTSTLTSKIIKE